MIANRNFEDCQPLTWIGRMPVYLATAIAGVQAVAMIVTSFVIMGGGPVGSNPALAPLVFWFPAVLESWGVWRYVTYAFVNGPDPFFLLQVIMLAWFGRDVEKFLGRRSFAWLCLLLLVAIPAMLTVLSLFTPMPPYHGAGALNFAVFLAFVMIYPRAQIIFGIEARWIAVGLMGVYSLMVMAARDWPGLVMLWWGCGVAAFWLRFEGVGSLQWPSLGDYLRQRRSRHAVRMVRPERIKRETAETDSIDPILDKIAREGIGSLTRGEREKLERARAALLEKERQR